MKKLLAPLLLTALSTTSVLASQESHYYQGYFKPTSILALMEQTALYNEENGYWEQPGIMNQELVRYLNTMEAEIASRNEEIGYWK